ncbi:ABC-1 domain protein [Vibrio parahaemolyticus VPTS-2010_2]|nr:ABC-1 domain protein [Vibrio parahaemolyticus VPTS-2010_2]
MASPTSRCHILAPKNWWHVFARRSNRCKSKHSSISTAISQDQ